jgi:hypothetical protein
MYTNYVTTKKQSCVEIGVNFTTSLVAHLASQVGTRLVADIRRKGVT